jgi:uncharacterized protein (DUF305 family)
MLLAHGATVPCATVRAVTFITLLVLLAGCGDDEAEQPAGNGTDRAFVAKMVNHHQSGVEMAQIAARRGESAFVKRLARDIAATQSKEIAIMRREDAALAREGIDKGSLEVSQDHDPAVVARADPFDPTFLRAMIDHHEGALVMAREERDNGADPELKRLAERIIETQQLEIAQMREKLGAGGAGDHHNP